MSQSFPFALCPEAHNPDGNVWAVKWPMGDIDDGQDWQLAPAVFVLDAVSTVCRGPEASQPRWYITGLAVEIWRDHDYLVISNTPKP